MPKYDFRCMTCGSEFELSSSMKEYVPPKYCTSCKSFTLKRIFNATPAVFRGTGWGGKP